MLFLNYKYKILIWGLRNLRQASFLYSQSQTKVTVIIEIGEEVFSATELEFGSLNINFNGAYYRKKIVRYNILLNF